MATKPVPYVALDACTIMDLLAKDSNPDAAIHWPWIDLIVKHSEEGKLKLASSMLSMYEARWLQQDKPPTAAEEQAINDFFKREEIYFRAVDRHVCMRAKALKFAGGSIGLADVHHIATAIEIEAVAFITKDGLPKNATARQLMDDSTIASPDKLLKLDKTLGAKNPKHQALRIVTAEHFCFIIDQISAAELREELHPSASISSTEPQPPSPRLPNVPPPSA